MTITNISTLDKTSHKTTILYPFGSYFSPFAWGTSLNAYWEIHPLIDNAFNEGKIRSDKPLLLDKENGKFHYLLADEKTHQILHFASDEKINYSANVIFNTIKNYIARPTSTINELVSALSDLKDEPKQADTPLEAPDKQPSPKKLSPVHSPVMQTSTVNTIKTFRESPPVNNHVIHESPKQPVIQPTFIRINKTETPPSKTNTAEKSTDGFSIHEKAAHETHESWLQRLLHFFSSLLCCFHHDVDPETEPDMHHAAAATKGRRL